MEAKELARALVGRGVEETCRWIAPGAPWKHVGQCLRVGSVAGDEGDSLGVNLTGDLIGRWRDYAGADHGDLLDLAVQMRRLQAPDPDRVTLGTIMRDAQTWLGLGDRQQPARPVRDQARPKSYKAPGILLDEVRRAGSRRAVEEGPVWTYLTDQRALKPDTIRAYRLAEVDCPPSSRGDDPAIVFPYLDPTGQVVGAKFLPLRRDERGKKRITTLAGCRPALFGWQAIPAGAREVCICEGEGDACSWYQYGMPALSIPIGIGTGGKQAWIEHELENLDRFDRIYLSIDNEVVPEGGSPLEVKKAEDRIRACRETVEELAVRLGRHRVRVVVLPMKDANECLQAGVERAIIQQALEGARTLDPVAHVMASTFHSLVMDRFYPDPDHPHRYGFDLPWSGQRDPIRFNNGEVTIVSGAPGHGKSQILLQLCLEAAIRAAIPTINASLEIHPAMTCWRAIRMLAGIQRPTADLIRQYEDWMDGWMYMLQSHGGIRSREIFEVFRHSARRYGTRWFVIDSLMFVRDVAADDYEAQADFVQRTVDFAMEVNGHVFLVAHPRETKGHNVGSSAELAPGLYDVAGSKQMVGIVHNVLAHWRNKQKEAVRTELASMPGATELRITGDDGRTTDLDQKRIEKVLAQSDALLYVRKNRFDGLITAYPLWYDRPSGLYRPSPDGYVGPLLDLTDYSGDDAYGG